MDNRRLASLWQHEARGRAQELSTLLDFFTASRAASADPNPAWQSLAAAVATDLVDARKAAAAGGPPFSRLRNWVSGGMVQAAEASLNAAEINLLRLAPLDYLASNLQTLVSDAKDLLPDDDPRLARLVDLARASARGGFTEQERTTVVAAIEAAKKASLRNQFRLRSFRNVVLIATLLASSLALLLAVVGIFAPDTLPLCYSNPGSDVTICPASGSPRPADLLLIEFSGVLGAAVSAVFSLRKVQGSADPYSISVALALLKVPTGALTAFLGLLMISAGFVPGLTALDSSAQILSWAVVFGYSQELFTRFVDEQGQSVLADAQYRPQPRPAGRGRGAGRPDAEPGGLGGR